MIQILVIEDEKRVADLLKIGLEENGYQVTSSSCHPKIFVKEFSYFLMAYHQHCLSVNLLVQR